MVVSCFRKDEAGYAGKYAHNDYFQALTEIGVIELILIIWALAVCLRAAVRNFRRLKDPLVQGSDFPSRNALNQWREEFR